MSSFVFSEEGVKRKDISKYSGIPPAAPTGSALGTWFGGLSTGWKAVVVIAGAVVVGGACTGIGLGVNAALNSGGDDDDSSSSTAAAPPPSPRMLVVRTKTDIGPQDFYRYKPNTDCDPYNTTATACDADFSFGMNNLNLNKDSVFKIGCNTHDADDAWLWMYVRGITDFNGAFSTTGAYAVGDFTECSDTPEFTVKRTGAECLTDSDGTAHNEAGTRFWTFPATAANSDREILWGLYGSAGGASTLRHCEKGVGTGADSYDAKIYVEASSANPEGTLAVNIATDLGVEDLATYTSGDCEDRTCAVNYGKPMSTLLTTAAIPTAVLRLECKDSEGHRLVMYARGFSSTTNAFKAGAAFDTTGIECSPTRDFTVSYSGDACFDANTATNRVWLLAPTPGYNHGKTMNFAISNVGSGGAQILRHCSATDVSNAHTGHLTGSIWVL